MAKIHNIKNLKENRKKLRNNLTPAEAKLWSLLKNGLLEGRKFRRQHSVGPYVLDFYCPKEKICIELDGMAHFTEEGHEYDTARTEYLSAINIRVLRFENKDVFENTEGVLEVIRKSLANHPQPLLDRGLTNHPDLRPPLLNQGGELKQTTPNPSLTKEGSWQLPVAIAAMILATCLFACTQTDQPPAGPAEKVTIAYSATPDSALAQVAQMQGYYLKEGLEATPQKYPLGKDALHAVLEGKADIATVAETPFMFAVLNGEKISVIATIQKSQRNYAVTARRDKGVLTPHDLKGKKIGVRLGTSGDFFLSVFLNSHGISRKDIKVVDLNPTGLRDALADGDVDAISALPFVVNKAQTDLGDRVITFPNKEIFTQFFNIVATQEFIRNNPGIVKKILRAFIKAEKFINQDPSKSQRIVADFSRLDKALVSEIWDVNDFNVTLDQSLLLELEDLSQWAIYNRLTKETKIPNYLDYIYFDGLLSVKPEAVRILR